MNNSWELGAVPAAAWTGPFQNMLQGVQKIPETGLAVFGWHVIAIDVK